MRYLITLLALLSPVVARAADAPRRPNVIFILADDLGFGHVGPYGQTKIKTPNLDRMAAEGMRFTQFYAGSTVCAPSRAVLMTGQHLGHTYIRGNGTQPLRPTDPCVARHLKEAGYATALCGKWGLGEEGSVGTPNKLGFDFFFGYLNQTHAHNYYPEFLYRNEERVALKNVLKREGKPYEKVGAGIAEKKVEYSHDLIADEALKWVDAQTPDRSFFLYLAVTLPHANNEAQRIAKQGSEVPDLGIYKDTDWPEAEKAQAAMVSRLDADVGRLFELLKRKGIDEHTLVIFTSDNGPHKEGGNDPAFFNASGPLRGIKRAMTDGGIRVPFLVRWPGKVKAGTTSEHVGYFGDFFATACELTATPLPPKLDSISFLPTLLGQPERQRQHEYLYWEFYEGGFKQAVRTGNHKGIRHGEKGKVQAYDLSKDVGETTDIADANPQLVRDIERMMAEAHVPSPDWKKTAPMKKPDAEK